jgi:hypothetical protein
MARKKLEPLCGHCSQLLTNHELGCPVALEQIAANLKAAAIVDDAPPAPVAEPVVKKPRARRAKKADQSPAALSLISSLKFISPVQKKNGTIEQQFCGISGGFVAASNEYMMICAPVEDDLCACPNTVQLLDALGKCGHELAITQLSEFELSVKSENFKASIPCVSFANLNLTEPDPNIAVIDDRIKDALTCVMGIATEGDVRAAFASVLLSSGSAVATNGSVLLEYWHGIDLPKIMIPKVAANAIAKANKTLVGFGYSGTTATFWFDDGAFIKTGLFNEQYPNYNILFDDNINPFPLPDDFFKGVHAVESFSKNSTVFFDNGLISSRHQKDEATTYIVEGVPDGMAFNSKYLISVEHAMKSAHFLKNGDKSKVFLFGENVRGIVMAMSVSVAPEHEEALDGPAFRGEASDLNNDDMPY